MTPATDSTLQKVHMNMRLNQRNLPKQKGSIRSVLLNSSSKQWGGEMFWVDGCLHFCLHPLSGPRGFPKDTTGVLPYKQEIHVFPLSIWWGDTTCISLCQLCNISYPNSVTLTVGVHNKSSILTISAARYCNLETFTGFIFYTVLDKWNMLREVSCEKYHHMFTLYVSEC